MRHTDNGSGFRLKRVGLFVAGMAALMVAGQVALRAEPTMWGTILVTIFIVGGLTLAAPTQARELVKTILPLLTMLRTGKARLPAPPSDEPANGGGEE